MTMLIFRELNSYLLSALSIASPSEAPSLAKKAIRAAVSLPHIFDLQALVSLPPIQQFQKDNDPVYEFLMVYVTGDLGSYRAFNKSHPTWLADNRIGSLF
jgi:hypothetical protein